MTQEQAYVRLETDAVKAYYEPPAQVARELEAKVGAFLQKLVEASAKFRGLTGWSVAAEDVAQAAEAFAGLASEHFRTRLSLADEDPMHLDAFLNRHLIAPELRGYFNGAEVKTGLPEADYQQMAMFLEGTEIPAEESLYYFLGAYWGEWLVRHRGAVWKLYAPLRPMQAFPDMVTSYGTVCLHPFSQVTKKLADPVGDNLAYKSGVFQDYLPPYPLTASLADSKEAGLSLLPEEMRGVEQAVREQDADKAFALLLDGLEKEPSNLLMLAQVQEMAWQAEEWEMAHMAMTALLRQHPHARTFYNLGVFYAQFDLMDQAIESMRQAVLLNPRYGRAKMTMALLLAEKGETAAAREILEQLLREGYDSALQEEAQQLLNGLSGA